MQIPQTPLRAVRLENGLTLNQVAVAVQLDVGNLSRIERGIQVASVDVAERLTTYFKGKITEMQILYPKRFTTISRENK
ncbi:helix-turn-helix domain-containing protein [Pantoea ananatis]|uniref:helix-turn-helix domain-containing protein n=1 Tax=Pantoea ananas TaxID=553 RepID=UPI00234FC8DA|nr:helix-turn-helix transcriptional regulator [Pantoea ananatis]MDC7860845.1 transcriptional regulator [Pantoea ananatis]